MSSPNNSSLCRLEWDESLSVGIPDIDVDHQRFIHLINELNEAGRNLKAAPIKYLLAEDMKHRDHYQQKQSLQTE